MRIIPPCPPNKSLIAGFVVFFLLAGCGARLQTTLVYRESLVEVYTVQMIGDEGSVVDPGYQHPLSLSPQEIHRVIQTIQVQHGKGRLRQMVSRSESQIEPAFSVEEAERISVGLSKALAEAGSADRIHFQLKHPVVLYGADLTTGVVFVKDHRFQIILQTHRYAPRLGSYDQNARFKDPFTADYSQSLTIIPGTDQELSSAGTQEIRKRWLLIDYKNLLGRKPKPEPEKTTRDDDALENRLETLKRWKEKELITDEEYQENRKEVLRQFLEVHPR